MRNDTKANWLLAGSALAFAAAFAWRLHHDGPAADVLYFLTQSAFIGSAADWFAVTALFRKPLGIPFHTALIPRHRARIIQGIRRTVETHLVRPELWQSLASSISVSAWLAAERTTRTGRDRETEAAEWIADRIREGIQSHQEDWGRLARAEVEELPPKLAGLFRQALTGDEQTERLLMRLLDGGISLLGRREIRLAVRGALKQFTEQQKTNPLIAMAVCAGESMGVISYDDMAAAICEAGRQKLAEWREPDHPGHDALREKLAAVIRSFMETPAAGEALEDTAEAVLHALPVEEKTSQMIGLILSDWDRPDAEGRSFQSVLLDAVHQTADRWLADEELCRRLDEACRGLLIDAAVYEHAFLGETVTSVLEAYDEAKLNHFIYSKVRDELGWVRMNGALFAAVSGACLFGLFALLVIR